MIKSDNKRVAVTMHKDKYKELKKAAIDANMTLSEYLITAGTITDSQTIKEAVDPRGSAVVR